MKLAITGASGKTGFRIAEEAISAGYDVRLIVRSQSEIPESIKGCERYVLSDTNGTTLDYALQGCESLVIATGARPSIDLTGPAKVDYLNIKKQIDELQSNGYGKYPVCVAKTQYSFSTDPTLRGAPKDHVISIREVRLAAGAEFIVMVCGDIMTMPGLPKVPAAEKIDLDTDGNIVGLF